jgi:Ca2+-transporting ATPase
MVILDDNFVSVVNACKWGRSVNDSIRKFLQFQLAINVGGVILTVVGSLASETNKEPFSPVQLLWLNLIMDTLAALALATEKPAADCLERLPVFKQAPLISLRMRVFIIGTAVFQVALIFLHLFSSHKWLKTVEGGAICDVPNMQEFDGLGNVTVQYKFCYDICKNEGGIFVEKRYCQQGTIHSTIIFNMFIWLQIFNIFNARNLFGGLNPFDDIFDRSQKLLIVVLLICGFQVFAVEVAGSFMQTTPLGWRHWLISIGFGALSLPVGTLIRLIPVRDEIPAEVEARWKKEEDMRASLGIHNARRMSSVGARRMGGGGLTPRLVHSTDPSLSHSNLHVAKR